MNLIGQKVNHIKWGYGQIVDMDESDRITVEFGEKTIKLSLDVAFKSLMTTDDNELQKKIEEYIVVKEAEKAKQKEERYNSLVLHGRYSGNGSVGEYSDKKFIPTKRTEGHALTFYCSQGQYFMPESELGLIWTPLYTHDGRSLYFWDNVMNAREGDIIIHSADGYIRAISRVKGSYADCTNPFKDWDKDECSNEGRKVECDYTFLTNPIATADYREDNIKYSQVKYAPFDKHGNGNPGYFFDLDSRLAAIFIKGIVEKNPEIGNIEYLQWLINMEEY